MKKTYILSLILFTAILIFGMLMTGCIQCFLDIGSLLMVLLTSLIMLLANYSPGDIGKYFSIGFSNRTLTKVELENGIVFFKTIQKYLLFSGALGFFLGLIAMLATLDAPEIIGRGMALALITVFYALILSILIAVPFRTGLEKKLNELSLN